MPSVVTTNHNPTTGTATFSCTENGTATPTAALSTLQVDGFDVLVATDVVGAIISVCTNSTTPCTAVASFITGASTKLKKGGVFVLLTGATFLTNGVVPAFTATDTQAKLTSLWETFIKIELKT